MSTDSRVTALRRGRPRPQRGNLTLIPGSVLPQRERCQQLANALPTGGVLLVVPTDNPRQKRALLAVAKLLARDGHQVKVISTTEVARRTTLPQLSFDL